MKDMEQITREDILESAIVLFGQHGFHNVSLDQLAEHLGHSKSLIYKHFKSKNSMMYAAVRMVYRQMQTSPPSIQEIQAKLENETPAEVLRGYCYSPEPISLRNSIYFRFLYREAFNFKRITAVTYRIWQNNFFVLCSILEHLAELDVIPTQPDRTLAEIWARVVFGFTLWKTFDPYIYEKEYSEIVDIFVGLALNGNNRVDYEVSLAYIENKVQQREPANYREKIMEAACQLFSEHGYEKTTIKMLAAKLGCHGSSIYNYFKDKQDIMQSIFQYMKEEKQDYVYRSFVSQYEDSKKIEDLVTAFSNNYIVQDAYAIKKYRIWMNMVYKNRDIRYYCLGCLVDKRLAFKIAIHELSVNREISNNESLHLASIYTFCQTSINIENALFRREISTSDTFRINFARIMVSIILHGVLSKDGSASTSMK